MLREYEKARAPEIDRYIQRWARRLILVIDGKVRRLTEDEVQGMAKPKRPKATRKRTARKTRTKSR